jgi:serine/threonine-protein kinase
LSFVSRPEKGESERCPYCDGRHPPHVLKCPKTDMLLPLEGRVLDGKFRLLRQIGKGGMASVWLAMNTMVDRTVAIKLIRPEVVRREDTVKRFRAEAKAAGRIGHPNICDILDLGSSPIGPYIVMEFLRGRSLAQWIRDEGPLPCGQAVAIVRQALAGLSAAHREGIIHRDLKPENLFIHEPEDGEPAVKLMDFGVSKFTDGSGEVETADGALLGTPEYMSPEQFRGAQHADQRTDVWAIGAILYRALTGENAFSGPTIAATLLLVSTEQPRPIHDLRADVPPGLVKIVERCLDKVPDERYPTAKALSEALAPYETETIPLSEEISAPELVDAAETRMRTTRSWAEDPRPRSRLDRRALAIIGLVVGVGALGSWYALDGLRGDAPPTVAADVVDDDAAEADTGEPSAAATGDDPETPAAETAAASTPDAVAPGLDTDASADVATAGTVAAENATGATAAADDDHPAPADEGDGDDVASGAAPEADDGERPRGDDPPRARPDPDPDPAPPPEPTESPSDPAGTIRFGPFLTPSRPGPTSDHRDAKAYCAGLASRGYLGITTWKLAPPSVADKLVGSKAIKRGSYWTSALWRARAIAIKLPAGKKSSTPSSRRGHRPLCVARWP